MNKKSIPGWTINIDEISNGVFKVTLTDGYGRKAEIIDNATDETIERAIGDAFDIEKQISQNWNLFLYNLAVQKLSEKDIKTKEYNDKVFGSWYIEVQYKRLVYDGKDSWLIFQTKTKGVWTDLDTIKKDELKYSNFVRQINQLTENTTHNSTLPKAGRSWWQKLFDSE
jgi:DNA mismatch repair ATPase MutS